MLMLLAAMRVNVLECALPSYSEDWMVIAPCRVTLGDFRVISW